MKMLILGASYGSLLSTKLLMAGHDAINLPVYLGGIDQ